MKKASNTKNMLDTENEKEPDQNNKNANIQDLKHNFQLSLFQLSAGSEKYYSNTIEFWDVIPKFFYGRMQRKQIINDKANSVMNVLPPLVRKTKYNVNKILYKITINPAVLVLEDKQTGKNIATYYYPSTREELVEEVLRKYVASGKGGFFDDDVSVFFSLREIQQDLKQSGHTYAIMEIKEALDIMNKTNIEIISENGDIEYKGSILITLVFAKKGRGCMKCFCSLNPLVSKAIKELRFRKYDYTKCMQYQIPLSRYIHKRISHYYKQIRKDIPYIILLSTLFNDSGYSMHESITKNRQRAEVALKELLTNKTVESYKIDAIKEKDIKTKTTDYKIYITPSESLMNDIISANARENQNNMHAQVVKNTL